MDEAGARYDRWVRTLGGHAGARYGALYREAYEFAGPDGCWDYLQMAMEIDEDHAAHKRALAVAARAEAAGRAQAAAEAVLQRASEIQLAVRSLAEDLHLAGPDFSDRPPMGRAEVDVELRAALGLATRAPDAYQEMLPPVAGLARMIGLRP